MENQPESGSTSNNENVGRELNRRGSNRRELNQFTIPTAASIQRQAQRVRDPRLFFSSSYTQQNTPQILTTQQAASQAADQDNIVLPMFVSVPISFINSSVKITGGRRSRKRNNKKRNIKTKKRYNS